MNRNRTRAFRRSSASRWACAALALLLAWQGAAVAAIAAGGRAHSHTSARLADIAAPFLLEDVRRGPRPLGVTTAHTASDHGHLHATGQRHAHGRGDRDVVYDDSGISASSASGDDADADTAAAALALLALLPRGDAAFDAATGDAPARRDGWQPSSHHPDPLERPPRQA